MRFYLSDFALSSNLEPSVNIKSLIKLMDINMEFLALENLDVFNFNFNFFLIL